MGQPTVFNTLGAEKDSETLRTHNLMNLTLHLFVNDITPMPDSVTTDFVEASFPGYAPISLSSWGAVTKDSDDVYSADHPAVSFTLSSSSGGQNIYGWFMTLNSEVYEAARDINAPIVLSELGQSYTIALTEELLRICPTT